MQPGRGRRETKQGICTCVSGAHRKKTVTGQAGGVIQRMPASNYVHSEHAQCALHSSGAPAAESLEALPQLSGSQASSFLARTHVMIDFKRL